MWRYNPILHQRRQPPAWFVNAFLLVFAALFITGATSVIAGRFCRDTSVSDAMRARVCSIPIAIANVLPSGDGQQSSRMERGILRANLGKAEAARADMVAALRMATAMNAHFDFTTHEARIRDLIEGRVTLRELAQSLDVYDLSAYENPAELFVRIRAEPAGSSAARIWDDILIKVRRGANPLSNRAG